MRREHLIQHTSGAAIGLIRRVSVASDIYCLCSPISLRIGHGNVTNALPPPGLITLLKRYHPHLLPGLNNMRNWWVFPSRIKFPTAGVLISIQIAPRVLPVYPLPAFVTALP